MSLQSNTVLAQLREWNPDAATSPTGGCMVDGVPTLQCLEVVFGNILYMAGGLMLITLFIMFVTGAFQYLTAFGSADKLKKAQGTLRTAIIGFVLFVSAFLILTIIDVLFLGGQRKIFEFKIGQ